MQLAQLLFVNRRRRLCQQTLGALRLGKSDHIADRFGTGHQGDDAVQPERETAVRWRPILQGIEQKAEFFLRFLGRDFQGVKDFLLHVGAVNTNRTPAHLPAIEHQVVALRDALLGAVTIQSSWPTLGAVKG